MNGLELPFEAFQMVACMTVGTDRSSLRFQRETGQPPHLSHEIWHCFRKGPCVRASSEIERLAICTNDQQICGNIDMAFKRVWFGAGYSVLLTGKVFLVWRRDSCMRGLGSAFVD